MEIENKKKLIKITVTLIGMLMFVLIIGTCSSEEKSKTKAEIAQEQKDSIQQMREKKINFALTHLKDIVKKNMKNPDSYDEIAHDYDRKDTLDTVKMYIKFRGDNSFGGKTISRVDAIYSFKKDNLDIVNQSTE